MKIRSHLGANYSRKPVNPRDTHLHFSCHISEATGSSKGHQGTFKINKKDNGSVLVLVAQQQSHTGWKK